MMFLCKELVASAEDPTMTQNPYALTKMDLTTIRDFDFKLMIEKMSGTRTGSQTGNETEQEDLQSLVETVDSKPQSMDEVDAAFL